MNSDRQTNSSVSNKANYPITGWVLRTLILAGCCLYLHLAGSIELSMASSLRVPCLAMAYLIKAEIADVRETIITMLAVSIVLYWAIDKWIHRTRVRFLFLYLALAQLAISVGIEYYYITAYKNTCIPGNVFDLLN